MICPVCGSEIYDDALFCENCGFNPDLDFDEWEED
jgi:predicted nucleic acid-binding Zn ribbon protein